MPLRGKLRTKVRLNPLSYGFMIRFLVAQKMNIKA